MDDLDALIAATGPSGNECRVGWWLSHGTHPDLDRLRLALDNPSASGKDVAAAFQRRGMDVGAQSVTRHRAGTCRCQS